ncbi:hypothetical protein ACWIGI_28535 [Nocardia sp. NPDC055321]
MFVPIDEPDTLHRWGFSDFAIAAVAGLDQKSVWKIRHRIHQTVTIQCAARIMSVTHVPHPAQSGMKMPNIGTRRRIQALLAIGWTLSDLGNHVGVTGGQFSQYTVRRWVLYETWAMVRDLYESLSGTPGPSRYGEKRARGRGLATPLQWEGVDIDHPDAPPDSGAQGRGGVDHVLVARILRGEHRGRIEPAERNAVLDHAVENSWSGKQVATALNVSLDTAQHAPLRRRRKHARDAA